MKTQALQGLPGYVIFLSWYEDVLHTMELVDSTMKSTYYIDILDHNLLDSAGNIFGDARIPFIF